MTSEAVDICSVDRRPFGSSCLTFKRGSRTCDGICVLDTSRLLYAPAVARRIAALFCLVVTVSFTLRSESAEENWAGLVAFFLAFGSQLQASFWVNIPAVFGRALFALNSFEIAVPFALRNEGSKAVAGALSLTFCHRAAVN